MKTYFSIGANKYYIFFENDIKDRVIYNDSSGNHFYKKNKKNIYFDNQQESEFREIQRKY